MDKSPANRKISAAVENGGMRPARRSARVRPARRSARVRPAQASGFSLLEILVATVLLILLSGAMVLNYSVLGKGSNFAEQTRRFETLLQFARAEAASRGRTVVLIFETGAEPKDVPKEEKIPGLHVVVHVLTDSFGDDAPYPVVLKDVPWAENSFYAAIRVESVRPLAEHEALTGSHTGAYGVGAEEDDALSSIRFYPDGSSDSAEIVLVSRDKESPRREQLRLIGITGTIVRRQLWEEELRSEPPPPDPRQERPGGQGIAQNPVAFEQVGAPELQTERWGPARERSSFSGAGRNASSAGRTEARGREPRWSPSRPDESTLPRRFR